MGKRLFGVIRFHFQFLCFSYAELLYSCACVFEMFACVEHQCPMMTDRDIAQMLTRVPWEEMGREDILMMHNNCAKSRKLGKCIVSSNRKLSSENNARINSIRCSIWLEEWISWIWSTILLLFDKDYTKYSTNWIFSLFSWCGVDYVAREWLVRRLTPSIPPEDE